jgi:hypothetical protein
MAESIANLNVSPSQVSGKLATWHRVMEEAGLSYEDLQAPIDDPEMRERLVTAWKNGARVEVRYTQPMTFTVFPPIEIDYRPFLKDPNEAFQQMVAAGSYGEVNQHFTHENFPIRMRGEVVRVTPVLVHVNRAVRPAEGLREVYTSNDLWRPGVEHGLAFGAKYPKEQEKYPIVIPCAPWRTPHGDKRVPALGKCIVRNVTLVRFDGIFYQDTRFLAVRK